MHVLKITVALFLFIFRLLPSPAAALSARELQDGPESPPAVKYVVTPASSPIKIDGLLEESAWAEALKVELPYQWIPEENTASPVKTECLITYSRDKLYIGFRCFDPEPKKVRAHLMGRDALDTFLQDDYVIIAVDSFNDERRAFQFRVNPLGVQADANFSELEGFEDFSWDAIWDSGGKITDFGYSVEVAIPFNQLRFPVARQKQTWGFSLARNYPRSVRYRMGSHKLDRNRNCILCQADKVHGFAGMSPGNNLEFDPTLTVNRTDQRPDFPLGEMTAGEVKVEPGITARWGITPNLILNAALNPDFSQVEADAAQLELNTRFALYYPEKRPFFLEGADFFLTPLEVVFTRTVFDPLWGAKVTGKMGRNALGFFATQDRYNNLIFPANQGSSSVSVKEDVFGGVVRFRRDIGKGSTLGLLYSGRTGDDYSNHVAGVDGFFRLSRTKRISFQAIASRTDYPEDIAEGFGQESAAFDGSALFFNFRHNGRKFVYGLDYSDLSPRFRADFGFIPRVDYRRWLGFIQANIWGKAKGWFNQINLWISGESIDNRDGQLTDRSLQVGGVYQGPLQTTLRSIVNFKKEFYNGWTYDFNQFELYGEMRPASGLKYFVLSRFGDAIDYSNSRLGRSFTITPGIECSLGKRWNIRLNHILERLSLKGEKIYTANLFQSQLVYNFNVRTFFRAIIQYADVDRNVDLYQAAVDAETKTLFAQMLFSYQINPQTVLFLGYSDNHLGIPGLDLTRKDRTFFLKIGYALVL